MSIHRSTLCSLADFDLADQKRTTYSMFGPDTDYALIEEGTVCKLYNSLQCRRILDARVHIFVLGRHLGFGNCGGLG